MRLLNEDSETSFRLEIEHYNEVVRFQIQDFKVPFRFYETRIKMVSEKKNW